jgi:hypothetical protein
MRDEKAHNPLDAAIASFVEHQRAFGRSYLQAAHTLRALVKFAGGKGANDLSLALFEQWSKAQL